MREMSGRRGAILRGRVGWVGGVGQRSESIAEQKKQLFGKLAVRVESAAANSPEPRAPSWQPIAPTWAGRPVTPTTAANNDDGRAPQAVFLDSSSSHVL